MCSTPVTLYKDIINEEIVNSIDISEELFDKIVLQQDKIELLLPAPEDFLPAKDFTTSRFLAKIALEALAEKLKGIENSLDNLIDNTQFDLIRNHARMGTTKDWPCSIRRIYATDAQWKFNDEENSKIIYECDFLVPNAREEDLKNNNFIQSELYCIIALWGMEFAINMGGPEIDGYKDWLIKHDNISPLYYGKNQPIKDN